jgi:hypothetical protein
MANLFFAGEKAPKQEAINSLTLKISEYYSGRYEVRAASDDGGHHLEIQIEVAEPSDHFEKQVGDFPPLFEIIPTWMGWRTLILKVPLGYIDAITNRADDDDY